MLQKKCFFQSIYDVWMNIAIESFFGEKSTTLKTEICSKQICGILIQRQQLSTIRERMLYQFRDFSITSCLFWDFETRYTRTCCCNRFVCLKIASVLLPLWRVLYWRASVFHLVVQFLNQNFAEFVFESNWLTTYLIRRKDKSNFTFPTFFQ